MVEEYDEMDENELADLGEEAHGFNVPNEGNRTEQQPVFNNEEEEIVFEAPNDDNEPAELNASDEEYEDSEEEDVSLDANADEEDTNEDTNPNLRRTNTQSKIWVSAPTSNQQSNQRIYRRNSTNYCLHNVSLQRHYGWDG
jgi:hypothetical protein